MKVDMRMSSSTSSNIKATASSWSAGSRRAAEVKCNTRVNIEAEKVVVNERSSPSWQARAHSNSMQFYYTYNDGSKV